MEPRSAATLSGTDLRSLAEIERNARDVLTQCGHLRRNGEGDEIRFGLIATKAFTAWKAAVRADNRAAKRSGWEVFKWWIPRGWAA